MRVELIKNTLHVYTDHADPGEVEALKALPHRRYQGKLKRWLVPYVKSTYEAWVELMPWPNHIEIPTNAGAEVEWTGAQFVFKIPFSARGLVLCRSFPGRRKWSKPMNGWLVWPTIDNLAHIRKHWPYAEWSADAEVKRKEVEAKLEKFKEHAAMKDEAIKNAADISYVFGTSPYDHQRTAFALSKDREVFGLFMEQGTGKTKVIVDNACYLFEEERLDVVVIVAPNSVKSTWAEEVAIHAPDRVETEVAIYSSAMTADERRQFEHVTTDLTPGVLRFLVLNVEAFSNTQKGAVYKVGKKYVRNKVAKGEKIVADFMNGRTAMMAVDESSRIKTPGAKRTKSIQRVAQLAEYRRVLSGTPITQGVLDIWAQFKFLDPDILGSPSYYSFRNRVAIVDQWGRVEAYREGALEEVRDMIDPHTYRVLRDDCLDLPPKIFEKRWVEMTAAQKKLYAQMKTQMVADLNAREQVTATIVLTQIMRLSQIAGGWAPIEDPYEPGATICKPIPGKNPKLEALLDVIDDCQGKVIIWARFVAEIEAIAAALEDKYGEGTAGKFYGPTPNSERTEIRRRFQDPEDNLRFFVGNPATGGLGLTLTQGKTVIYYSNSFSLEERLQSEDRAHRIGQDTSVVYVDLVMKGTVDQKVVAALRSKQKIANAVTGDKWKDWI
jgi:SNF2 family DNA or RNA helicase